MKSIKKFVVMVMACSLLLGLVGCAGSGKIKAYNEDRYMEILGEKLGIDEDHINTFDGIGYRGARKIEGTQIQAHYKNCIIFISIYDDEEEAEFYFNRVIDPVIENVDSGLYERSEIEYQKEDGIGYVLCYSDGYCTPEFAGDINRTRNDCYVAAYYCDNVVVRFIPNENYKRGDSEQIIEIIEAFGYPTLEDVKRTE